MDNYQDESYYEKFITSSKDQDEERFVSSSKTIDDAQIENVLRPKTMDDYVGQTKVKEN